MSTHAEGARPAAAIRSIGLAAVLCLCGAAGAQPPDYAQAVQLYRQGRVSAAYGMFVAAANNGDPDAARVALFMLRYGPVLYATHWDASTEEVENWSLLARSARAREQPAFRPLQAEPREKAKSVPVRVARASAFQPAARRSDPR
jgi:hypothetical protein